MKLKAFLQQYNASPFGRAELASIVVKVDDDNALSSAAMAFLDAQAAFEAELGRVGYESG